MSLFSWLRPQCEHAAPSTAQPQPERLSLISPIGTPVMVFLNPLERPRVTAELVAMLCPCAAHPKLCRIPTAKGLS